MDKISEEKLAAVLVEVPATLRALGADRDLWRDKAKTAQANLDKIAQDSRIAKIAQEMETKGLDSSLSIEKKIEGLQKKAAQGRLDAIEEAVGMRPGDIPLGEIADEIPGQASSDLEQFILGDLA